MHPGKPYRAQLYLHKIFSPPHPLGKRVVEAVWRYTRSTNPLPYFFVVGHFLRINQLQHIVLKAIDAKKTTETKVA